MDLVVADADAPPVIADSVVDADLAGVALAFHGVAAESACCGRGVAGAHEDWVSGLAEVVCARVRAGVFGMGWCWKPEACRGEGFARGFEGDDRDTKCHAEEG